MATSEKQSIPLDSYNENNNYDDEFLVESPQGTIYDLIEEMKQNDETVLNGEKYCSLSRLFALYIFGCISKQRFLAESKSKYSPHKIYSYRAQSRLIHLWIICLLILLFSNHTFIVGSWSNGFINFFFALCMVFCIVLIVFAYYGSRKKGVTFWTKLNDCFGIPTYDDALGHEKIEDFFSQDRRYYGLLFVFFVFLTSFVKLMIFSMFWIEPSVFDNCAKEDKLSADKGFASNCAVNQSTISQAYLSVAVLLISAFSYYTVNPQYIEAMSSYLAQSNLQPKIVKMNSKIQHELEINWKESHRWYNRTGEGILTYLVTFSFHVITYGMVRNDIFGGNIQFNAMLFCLFIYACDALMVSFVFYFLLSDAYYYFTFPAYILDGLANQFESESIKDIISWWHLRNYYLDCVISVFASSLSGFMAAALFGVLILFSLAFAYPVREESLIQIFLFFGALVLCGALIIARLAAAVETKQLAHVHTLNREHLKLEFAKIVRKGSKGVKGQNYCEVIRLISEDIKENTKPIRVFGLVMNAQFLIAIRGSAVALIMAYFFS